jgi:hypothetical protein
MNARTSTRFRLFGWIAVGALLALAVLGPNASSALALSGAVYTSNADGSQIDQNIYAAKGDVYLTGGPCNGGSHLDAGTYYFQVVQPAGGGDLLSTDAIGNRQFTVGANGFISSTTGTHVTHTVNCTPAVTGITLQLLPYGDSANGEYKLEVATASSVEACEGFDAASTTFTFCQAADQKSDNFKVGESPTPTPTIAPTPTPTIAPTPTPTIAPTPTPTIAPTPTPTIAPTPTPTIAPTPTPTGGVGGATATPTVAPTATPTGGVEGATGTPTTTLPPTDTVGGSSPTSGGWRILLVGMAGLLATVLLLAPSPKRNRR